MALIEREVFMASLQEHFENIESGEGYCMLVCGEAGIGKTALVKAFCKQKAGECSIYQGACDALFTPRPLAPLYDVLWQVNKERWSATPLIEDRTALFSGLFQELLAKKEKILLVFEDIHWADEGTLDFIKFFVRRIYQLPCFFILTYRDDEIYSRHPLRNVLGQLPQDSFTKLNITPLSKQAVVEMAAHKGYSGEDVFTISAGNPFYVNEILASYSPGVPDNIKDSILAVYERQADGTKNAWQIFSLIPEGLETERFHKIKMTSDEAVNHCFAINVLVFQNNKVIFKHELYRRTIEESLMPFRRIELNKLMLELFLESFEEKGEIERILHYAKSAGEKELVVKYAPQAAAKAGVIGAHKEAAKLYLTAIEYSEGIDKQQLAALYEAYANECYLCNEIKQAIIFTEKVLLLWQEQADIVKRADSLRFLSRLCWFDGNRVNAERFGHEAIDLLKDEPVSSAKAMAFSNMSQLKMLSDHAPECIAWGEKAIAMAAALSDDEVHCHALNNVGSIRMYSVKEGREMLNQSLEIALRNNFHEHAARAYSNLGSNFIKLKEWIPAAKALEEGIRYCEERGLNSWASYMLSWKARLSLETGNWTEAYEIADGLLKNENQPAITRFTSTIVIAKIKMRKGEAADAYLDEMRRIAFENTELQRVVPCMIALMEYEWLTGKSIIEKDSLEKVITMIQRGTINPEVDEFAFWMKKAGRTFTPRKEIAERYDTGSKTKAVKAANFWEHAGYPYEQALLLFEGTDEDKRDAISIMQNLNANAVYEKLKLEMKNQGIKNIPRGIRNSTRSNAAFLTGREMDVLQLMKQELQNKEIASQLYISAKTVDHHISSILFKLDASSRTKAVTEAVRMGILK